MNEKRVAVFWVEVQGHFHYCNKTFPEMLFEDPGNGAKNVLTEVVVAENIIGIQIC